MTTEVRIQAKKSLGQNFLVNPHVLDRIVEVADIKESDTIIEVGPGTGILTERLIATGAHIIAIEKDRRLIDPLKEKFSENGNLHLLEADILEINPEDIGAVSGEYKIVANIPYYLTSHLIRLMFEIWPRPELAVLMVQEEVARRIVATPPDMNLLALSVQLYARPEMVARVSRNSFRPVPNVDSAVILLNSLPAADATANERILKLARGAFGQKRKKLSATIPHNIITAAGLDPARRPQELSVEEWKSLDRHSL